MEILDRDATLRLETLDSLVKAKQIRSLRLREDYRRSFEAAQFNRLTSSWAAVDFSPAQELYNDLRVLRVRSREQYCNSPVVSNFVSLLQQNVIGHTGFGFRSQVPNARGGINTKVSKQIEAGWADYCTMKNFEVTGQYSLVDSLDLMMQSMAVDGEILLKKVYGEGKYGMQMQLLHAEQLIIDKHNNFDLGIKRNRYGRPVEYCLTTHHPGEGHVRYAYEPAALILHAYIPYQIGAPRGVPMPASVMSTIKRLDEYQKAEVIAARIQASAFVSYEQDQPDTLDDEIFLETAQVPSIKRNTIEPGQAETLPPGVKAKWNAATHPTTAYPDFIKSGRKEVAAGMGLSYNTLYSDFENTSFSSMRAAFISERAFYRKLQAFIIEKVLDQIFDAWLDVACANGVLKLPMVMGSFDFYKAHTFTGKSYEFANPLQEAEAQALLVAQRLRSRTQICAENGTTYEQVLDDIKAEQELEERKGIQFVIMPKASTVTPVTRGATDLTTPPPASEPEDAPAPGSKPSLDPASDPAPEPGAE